MNSNRSSLSLHRQVLIPATVTIRDSWPSGLTGNMEPLSMQISISHVHQALLMSILGIRTVMTLPHLNSRYTSLDAHKSTERSWLVSSMLRFWSVAFPHLQVSCLSSSWLNWSGVFLDTFTCYFSILAKIPFDSTVATKVSNLFSQVGEIFLLRMDTTPLATSTQKLLCAAYLELAFLCQRSPKWSLVLLEHVLPTLHKVENRSKAMSRDLEVSVNPGSTRECAHA